MGFIRVQWSEFRVQVFRRDRLRREFVAQMRLPQIHQLIAIQNRSAEDWKSFCGDEGFRGGSFQEVAHRMRAYVRAAQPVTAGGQNYGFRVAVVPEPSTLMMASMGMLVGLAAFLRRRKVA